ncbi:MAG: hypothetical protein EBR82_31475 [Caulobacteraceae bacterium]|nr:hypothetical protein [Caulobacteraceae bacterium]
MAVARLRIAPSEFWRMPPRHFWWLLETLEEGTKPEPGGSLGADEKAQLMHMLREARKGL